METVVIQFHSRTFPTTRLSGTVNYTLLFSLYTLEKFLSTRWNNIFQLQDSTPTKFRTRNGKSISAKVVQKQANFTAGKSEKAIQSQNICPRVELAYLNNHIG